MMVNNHDIGLHLLHLILEYNSLLYPKNRQNDCLYFYEKWKKFYNVKNYLNVSSPFIVKAIF